jgi:hypothetical protein
MIFRSGRYRSALGASLLERGFLWVRPRLLWPVQQSVNSLGSCRHVKASAAPAETVIPAPQAVSDRIANTGAAAKPRLYQA